MDSIRFFSIIIAITLYAAMYSLEVALMVFIVSVIILFIVRFAQPFRERTINSQTREQNRLYALNTAKMYLSPHRGIWHNLRLSNKNCNVRLGNDGYTITVTEKASKANSPYKILIFSTKKNRGFDLWDTICINFDNYTTYYTFVDMCNEIQIPYKEEIINNVKTKFVQKEKVDINNATEVELTALPGISIVLSKKIIKKREEIGGFKRVQDVFVYLKLKQHMQNQLQDLICVNKMKGSVNIIKTSERQIDL